MTTSPEAQGDAALAIAAVRHDMVAAILSVTHPSPYFAYGELERELRPLMLRLEQVAQRRPELMGALGAHFGASCDLSPIQEAVAERAKRLLDRRLARGATSARPSACDPMAPS